VDRDDAIPRLLHVPGDPKAGPVRFIGKPYDSDGFGFFEDGADGFRFVQWISLSYCD
jgi:hypothetical protein